MKQLILLLLALPVAAQQKDAGDEIVSVPKKYVSSEGLAHQDAGQVNKWIGMGKEIGIATREGLNAVVDTSEKFGATRVGNFVMFLIAWKVMARELLGVVLGIPLLIAGISMWVWIAKRMFFGYRVLVRREGKVKTFADHAPINFDSRDAKVTAGSFLAIAGIAFTVIMLIVIF